MTTEILFEIFYTVAALVAALIGMYKFFRKKKPLFIQMVVCMVGCRFFNGLLDLLLVKSKMSMETFTVSSLVQLAQFLFLICASIGALDSLCDDGAKANRKYRIISALIPVAIYIGLILFAIYDDFNMKESLMMLIPVLVPLYSLYFHIKHLIIPDVEGGIVRSIRPYNAMCVLNVIGFLMEYAFEFGYWYVSMTIGILVSITILPVLARGVKKWFA